MRGGLILLCFSAAHALAEDGSASQAAASTETSEPAKEMEKFAVVEVSTYCDSAEAKPNAKDGSDYKGCVNVTRSGKPCLPWKVDHPTYSVVKGTNYCRNANGRRGVWCNWSETEWEYCDINITCAGDKCGAPQCEWPVCVPTLTEQCMKVNRVDGTYCDDGNVTTVNDACKNGVCKGVSPCDQRYCNHPGQCRKPGVCVEPPSLEAGLCRYENEPDGTVCDDGNNKTSNDQCKSGVCIGSLPCGDDTCEATACLLPVCTDDTCSHVPLPDGTDCNDDNIFTQADKCTNGVCKGLCLGRDECGGDLGEGDGDCSEANPCAAGLKCGPVGSCAKIHVNARYWPATSRPYQWDLKDACCIKDDKPNSCADVSCKDRCNDPDPSEDYATCTCSCSIALCALGNEDDSECCPDFAEHCDAFIPTTDCSCEGRCGEDYIAPCGCSCSDTCDSSGSTCCKDVADQCLATLKTECTCTPEQCGLEYHPECGCSCSVECRRCYTYDDEMAMAEGCDRCCHEVEKDCEDYDVNYNGLVDDGEDVQDTEEEKEGKGVQPVVTTGPSQCANICGVGGRSGMNCKCDQLCAVHRDCCEDKVTFCGGVATLETCTCRGACGRIADCGGCSCKEDCSDDYTCCPDFPGMCQGKSDMFRPLTAEEKAERRLRARPPAEIPWQLLAVGLVAALVLIKGRRYMRS